MNIYKLLDDSDIDSRLKESLRDWLTYKKERKDKYTETGLKKLITQTKKYAEQYGIDAVSDVIDLSISNQWQGILWKKLEESKLKCGAYMDAIKNRVDVVDSW